MAADTVQPCRVHQYYVYIAASLSHRLYVGMTNNLPRRMAEHVLGTPGAHTQRYRITRLVYAEHTTDVRAAIAREKQLKRWPRWRKCRLIEAANPDWRDLGAAPEGGRGCAGGTVTASTLERTPSTILQG